MDVNESFVQLGDLFIGISTIISAVIAFIGLMKYKENKSYDLFTEKRLKNYDYILSTYQKILAISSPEYLDRISAVDVDLFVREYEVELKKLNGSLSTTERQEYYLLKEYDILFEVVIKYVSKDATKADLENQLNLILIFTDLYLWALWAYIQELHKLKSLKMYHNKFDTFFAEYYKRTKDLNVQKTDFFIKYPLELLVPHCPKRFHCTICNHCFRHH